MIFNPYPTVQEKISVLRIHADTVHGGVNTPAQNTAGPSARAKIDPPKIHAGSDVQAWDHFTARWEIFKSTMSITTSVSMWLFNCLDEELGGAVLQANTNPALKDMSEQALLLSIKALAVKKESKLVHRIKLGRTSQPSGVPIRNHLAAPSEVWGGVRGQASDGENNTVYRILFVCTYTNKETF